MANPQFDLIAEEYDESLPAHVVEHYLKKRADFVVDRCPPGDGLDVGCGTGVLAERLAHRGFRMTGVDPSPGMLGVLRRRTSAVAAVEGPGDALPFSEGSFDLVMCVAVMHHVAEPGPVRDTLAEMVRVVRPGGRVLVWDHNPRNPYWKNLMARVPQDTGEERLVPEDEVVAGLQDGGGEIVSSVQLGMVPDFVAPVLLPLAAAVERNVEKTSLIRYLGAHNVVVATKR